MEYYYLGTESWWCGNWNHLVCRRSKCEVDQPSQSTVVNLYLQYVYICVETYSWNNISPNLEKAQRRTETEELSKCLFLSQQKMVSHIVCCQQLIFYLYWNHEYIFKKCCQALNNHSLYMKLLHMCYFKLHLDYVASKYTPELPGFPYCFLLMFKQQCISVW